MSKKRGRYDVSDLPEAQFEPGSKGRVLKNLLGITDQRQIERTESELLANIVATLLQTTKKDHRFTARDI